MRLLLLCSLVFCSLNSHAKPLKVCVWDLIGKSGPITENMKDYRLSALQWGVDLQIETYSSERIATEQFRAKVCDATMVSGFRAKEFVPFSGSLNAVGGIPDNRHLELVLKVMADPRSANNMVSGPFEIAGIAAGGAVYVFVRDRAINSLAKASGHKVAVLDFDKQQQRMIATIGATPVPVNVTNAGGKFNNGDVDVFPAPGIAYEALELYKGMEPKGGVIRYPLAQSSLQLVLWKDHFPAGFAQKSRAFFFANFGNMMKVVNDNLSAIKPKYWIEIPPEELQKYELLMAETRASGVKQNYWSKKMILLQRKVRCKFDLTRAECSKPKDQL